MIVEMVPLPELGRRELVGNTQSHLKTVFVVVIVADVEVARVVVLVVVRTCL